MLASPADCASTPKWKQIAPAAKPEVKARFDASGRRIEAPVRGLNILHMSDGTVRKVMVK